MIRTGEEILKEVIVAYFKLTLETNSHTYIGFKFFFSIRSWLNVQH